ncbi:MAG: hypothetical protein JEZ06_20250 [Anaerolineaceae bacterium]|nr:hypothetical protein [Anaerolineaceae bacterium]
MIDSILVYEKWIEKLKNNPRKKDEKKLKFAAAKIREIKYEIYDIKTIEDLDRFNLGKELELIYKILAYQASRKEDNWKESLPLNYCTSISIKKTHKIIDEMNLNEIGNELKTNIGKAKEIIPEWFAVYKIIASTLENGKEVDHKNIIEYLYQDIEFEDLVKIIVDLIVRKEDIKLTFWDDRKVPTIKFISLDVEDTSPEVLLGAQRFMNFFLFALVIISTLLPYLTKTFTGAPFGSWLDYLTLFFLGILTPGTYSSIWDKLKQYFDRGK